MYAPDFTLKNVNNGNNESLGDYQGQAVIVFFWAIRCPYCEREVSSLEQIYEIYKDTGLVVLAIDVGESAKKARNYRDAHGLTFPILNDSGKVISAKYRVTDFPTHFFVDATGRISSISVGMLGYWHLNSKARAILNLSP